MVVGGRDGELEGKDSNLDLEQKLIGQVPSRKEHHARPFQITTLDDAWWEDFDHTQPSSTAASIFHAVRLLICIPELSQSESQCPGGPAITRIFRRRTRHHEQQQHRYKYRDEERPSESKEPRLCPAKCL